MYNYRYRPYRSNKKLFVIPRLTYDKTHWIIEAGYHSVLSPIQPVNKITGIRPNITFIIPKSAIYYINELNEVVSSEIVMTDKLV